MRFARIIFSGLAAALLVYVGDYVSVRFRIPNNREQFATVQVQRIYAVTLKNKKTEYMFDQPRPQTCVNSLFPQLGAAPCWYVESHTRQRVDINNGSSDFWRLPSFK